MPSVSVRFGRALTVCLACACHSLPAAHDNAATAPACSSDADCGIREHAKQVVCQHGAFCMAVCEDHWGDCNDDYRDGCEQSIEHRVYCKGDPRIGSTAQRRSISINTRTRGRERSMQQASIES